MIHEAERGYEKCMCYGLNNKNRLFSSMNTYWITCKIYTLGSPYRSRIIFHARVKYLNYLNLNFVLFGLFIKPIVIQDNPFNFLGY